MGRRRTRCSQNLSYFHCEASPTTGTCFCSAKDILKLDLKCCPRRIYNNICNVASLLSPLTRCSCRSSRTYQEDGAVVRFFNQITVHVICVSMNDILRSWMTVIYLKRVGRTSLMLIWPSFSWLVCLDRVKYRPFFSWLTIFVVSSCLWGVGCLIFIEVVSRGEGQLDLPESHCHDEASASSKLVFMKGWTTLGGPRTPG